MTLQEATEMSRFDFIETLDSAVKTAQVITSRLTELDETITGGIDANLAKLEDLWRKHSCPAKKKQDVDMPTFDVQAGQLEKIEQQMREFYWKRTRRFLRQVELPRDGLSFVYGAEIEQDLLAVLQDVISDLDICVSELQEDHALLGMIKPALMCAFINTVTKIKSKLTLLFLICAYCDLRCLAKNVKNMSVSDEKRRQEVLADVIAKKDALAREIHSLNVQIYGAVDPQIMDALTSNLLFDLNEEFYMAHRLAARVGDFRALSRTEWFMQNIDKLKTGKFQINLHREYSQIVEMLCGDNAKLSGMPDYKTSWPRERVLESIKCTILQYFDKEIRQIPPQNFFHAMETAPIVINILQQRYPGWEFKVSFDIDDDFINLDGEQKTCILQDDFFIQDLNYEEWLVRFIVSVLVPVTILINAYKRAGTPACVPIQELIAVQSLVRIAFTGEVAILGESPYLLTAAAYYRHLSLPEVVFLTSALDIITGRCGFLGSLDPDELTLQIFDLTGDLVSFSGVAQSNSFLTQLHLASEHINEPVKIARQLFKIKHLEF